MAKNQPTKESDPYVKVWEALLRQQRKTRYLSTLSGFDQDQAGGELAFGEALLLLVVEAEPGKSVGEVASQLGLERSWVSRMITSLEKRGFVAPGDSTIDRRIKNISITKKGSDVLGRLLEARARVIAEVYKRLNDDEQKELARLLKKLADGLHAPPYSIQPQTHPIDAQLARISWMVGVVGDNMMNSGMSVTKYQLLYILAKRKEKRVSPSDLAKLFPVNFSSISRFITTLEKEGTISRQESSEDGRMSLVQITKKGLSMWQEAQRKSVATIAAALAGVPIGEVKRLSELISKATLDFVGKLSHHPRHVVDIRPIQLGEIEEMLASSAGRRLQLLRNALAAPSKAKLFGFFEEGSVRSILSVEVDSTSDKYKEILLSGSDLTEEGLTRFLRVSLKAVSSGQV